MSTRSSSSPEEKSSMCSREGSYDSGIVRHRLRHPSLDLYRSDSLALYHIDSPSADLSHITRLIYAIIQLFMLCDVSPNASFDHRDAEEDNELLSEEKSLAGFDMLKPCGRNKDHTVCVKRSVVNDSLTFKKSKEKEKPPWPDDKRDPKNQQKLTVDEKDGKAIFSTRGLIPSVNPTLSNSFSTKVNSPTAQRTTFSSDSVGSVSPSVDRLGKSIGPSLIPAIPTERQSPPKVQRTKSTENPDFNINTGEPPRTEEHNTEFRRHKTSQSGVKARRGMRAPRNKTSSRSQSFRHWLWTVLTVMTALSLTAFQANMLVRRHFKDIKVSLANETEAFSFSSFRGSDNEPVIACCFTYAVSLANEAEASRFSSFGSDNEPVTVRHCRVIYQQVGAGTWRDVLRNLSIEEVAIENVDKDYSGVEEKFYQGLLTWMRSRGTQTATTKKLCEALCLAGCSEALEKLSRELVEMKFSAQRTTFSSDSVGSVSPSEDRLGKSIDPCLTPPIPAERQSLPKVQRTKATENPELYINTGEPPRTEEHITEFRRHKTSHSGVEARRGMPAPRNKTSSRSPTPRHWLWTVLTVITAASLSLTEDMETFQGNQLVWRHFNEIKVSLANEAEAFCFSSFGSDNEPVTEIHCRVIYQLVGAGTWRVVLRNLNIEEATIENVDADYSEVSEKFYQGLLAWSRGTQGATTKKLCEALCLAGCSEALEKLSRGDSMANVTEASRFSSFGSDNEPVTEIHCRVIYQQVGGKWRDVLRNLSIAEVTIENVDEDNSTVAEKFYQGLLKWMRSCGTQTATTKKLCEALCLAGCPEALETFSREVSFANETKGSSFSSLGSDNEPVTEIHCRRINQLVGGKWKDVLRNLSIAEVAIENVDEDNSKVAEKLHQGLLEWSRGTQRATTKKLCEALRLAGCSEALEKLSREGVTNDAPAPIPESTVDLGTCM